MVPPVPNARGLVVDLYPLQARVARIDIDLILHISAPDFGQSEPRATIELMNLLFTDASKVRCQYAIDKTLKGVHLNLEKNGVLGPVTFLGTPSGYELEALVHALECWAEPGRTTLDPSYQRLMKEIIKPLGADLFVAPT